MFRCQLKAQNGDRFDRTDHAPKAPAIIYREGGYKMAGKGANGVLPLHKKGRGVRTLF